MPARHFPPPWSVEELDACFVVRDRNGQALAYVYFEDKSGRRPDAKRLRTLEDENSKLKRLLADAMLDNAMLKEIAAKKW